MVIVSEGLYDFIYIFTIHSFFMLHSWSIKVLDFPIIIKPYFETNMLLIEKPLKTNLKGIENTLKTLFTS